MAVRTTNKSLGELLLNLGFLEKGIVRKKHRVWRHPESGCTLVLPVNKTLEAPRPADIVGIKAQLAFHGHLDGESFDFFTLEGALPAQPSAQPG